MQAALQRSKAQIIRGCLCLGAAAVVGALLLIWCISRASASTPTTIVLHSAHERSAVQCRGTRPSGLRCGNRTRNESGYCFRHLHQGVKIVNVTP